MPLNCSPLLSFKKHITGHLILPLFMSLSHIRSLAIGCLVIGRSVIIVLMSLVVRSLIVSSVISRLVSVVSPKILTLKTFAKESVLKH